jgi:chemotaxis protein MotB
MPKKEEESSGGAPEWMCTFSDMMSLLLCFFVLLFSMSTIEKEKFVQAISSIQGALGRIPGMYNMAFVPPVSIQPQKSEPTQRNKTIERAKEAIAKKARSKLVALESSSEIIVEGVKEGIRFSLTGRILFARGMSVVSTEGQKYLDIIAETLRDFGKLDVRIEGHTDSSPMRNSSFRDNWTLAYSRAFNTMVYLRDDVPAKARIDGKRFSVMSCSDNRPRFPDTTPEYQDLNRRVEIVLLQSSNSESIMGILEGSEEARIIPIDADFLPIK